MEAFINETLDYNPDVKCSHHKHSHGEDIYVVSMVVEVTAVIRKNSKNNNTKGCVKVMEKLP